MRWCLTPLRRASSTLALVLALAPAACGTSTAQAPLKVPEGPITPAAVSDGDFAEDVHRLLRDGAPTIDREALLIGVVRRQLAHAAERFAAGHDRRGTDSVLGALYLMRSGEGRGEMIDDSGERALRGAIERISPRGDEGQAETLMRMRIAALKAGTPERAALEEHLASLETWIKETRTGGTMERLGTDERAAVSRAMVDPPTEVVEAAAVAVDAWIAHAIEYNIELRQSGRQPERNEVIEAQRALMSGGSTMASIFLRHGDAKGAFDHLERSSARRIVSTTFFDRIRRAAEADGAHEWQSLAAAYANQDIEDGDDGLATDPALVNAGLWGTALESYRRDSSHVGSALLVARSLVGFGMSEAAPLVMADALGKSPPPQVVMGSLAMLLEALTDAEGADDPAAARRTFASAGAILAAADSLSKSKDLPGRLNPSASRARFVMASIELRAGNMAGARPLLESAVAAEPSVSGYTLLATLERQAGNPEAAIANIEHARTAPDARKAPLDLADAEILAFEIHRDGGAPDKANRALDAALAGVIAVRLQMQSAPSAGASKLGGYPPAARARAERLLGHVLDGYGDVKGATRALDRALSAAAGDRPVLAATVLDAVGRALVRKDVTAARAALKRGLDGDVAEEDLVYGGLWLLLLEKQQRVATDGTAERALRAAERRGSWTGKLAAWASGKLSEEGLRTAAHNLSQRVEANFYTALASKVAGDPGADARLRDVAHSPIIDLLEVQIARDMVAPSVRTELPGNVALP